MTPAMAVVAKRASVVAGLASQTSRSTRGSAAVVPVTDCLKFRHPPRRAFGLLSSGGCSPPGSPDMPLLAGPVSADLRLPSHQCIAGGPAPGPIIPMLLAAYPPASNHTPRPAPCFLT